MGSEKLSRHLGRNSRGAALLLKKSERVKILVAKEDGIYTLDRIMSG